jgi:hypothetical protein
LFRRIRKERKMKTLMKGGIVLIAALALLAGCVSYSVDSLEVSVEGNATAVDAGQTLQFNFYVYASGKDTSGAQRVKWSVSSTSDGRGEVTQGTSVSPGGTLMVSADEIYPVLFVRATHDYYTSKYDFKQIQVRGPKVGSVVMSVTGNAASVVAGANLKFSAFVAGQAPNQGLTYSVWTANNGTGAPAAGTAIAADGTLTVSANETASSLYVRAVSNSDATKFDTKEIRIVSVTSVTVTAEGGNARVVRGNRLKFNAAVAGNNSPAQNVTWKVSSNAAGDGAVSPGTAIGSDGTLTVAATEAAATLYVIATSTVNTARSGSIQVTIPTVTLVSVSPVNPTIRRGDGQTFTARVQGTGNPGQEVTWKLDGVGGTPSATTITSNGMLIVSPAETLSGLIVTATSVDDPTKSGTSMITIPATPAAVVPATPPPQAQAPAPTPTPAPAPTPAPPVTPAPQPLTPPTVPPQTSVAGDYVITGSGTAFTATRNGATVGTANQPIQTVIEAIRANANGAACAIFFGNGTTTLNTGTTPVSFNNTGGNWGPITLKGRLTSSTSSANNGGTIVINGVAVTSTGSVANTATVGRAFINLASGTLNITGGEITATSVSGIGVNNVSNGAVVMSGGVILTGTAGNGIYGDSTGSTTITGGFIQTTSGSGVVNYRGTTTITGGTIQATQENGVAVNNIGSGVTEIRGGTILATGTNTKAVRNYLSGTVNINGGTITAGGNGSYAIYNQTDGKINVGTGVTVTGPRYP